MLKQKIGSRSSKPNNVDQYLAKVPAEARATLEKLRRQIKAAAPRAVEVISYDIPMFKQDGLLFAFAAFKNHCSFFPGAAILKTYEDELKGYKTSKGTIRFPSDQPLPASLVKRLVKARIKENEAKKQRSKKS
jgi:uncharacterized protein YdhG (YjbR/CyaY superfamily)